MIVARRTSSLKATCAPPGIPDCRKICEAGLLPPPGSCLLGAPASSSFALETLAAEHRPVDVTSLLASVPLSVSRDQMMVPLPPSALSVRSWLDILQPEVLAPGHHLEGWRAGEDRVVSEDPDADPVLTPLRVCRDHDVVVALCSLRNIVFRGDWSRARLGWG